MAIENHSHTQKPKIIFILVNGTFANEGEWIKSTSSESFRAKLRKKLEAKAGFQVEFCDEFSWGHTSRHWRYFHDNKMKVRLDSGKKLRDHLLSFSKSEDDTRHYIIAHSHGGNVALYALKDQKVREKIDGLICLGTPFLISKPEPNIFGFMGFSAAFLTMYAWLQQSWLLWIYTSLYLALAVIIMKSGNWKNKLTTKIDKYEELRLPVKEIMKNDRPKVLTFYTPHDEAFWLLRVTGKIGKPVRWIGGKITSIVGLVIAVNIGITLMRPLIEKLQLDLLWLETAQSFSDQVIAKPLLLVLTGILTSIVLLRLSYAYDSAPWVANFDTQVQRKLDNEIPWLKLPKDTSAIGLRHSNVPIRSVEEIAKWVCKKEKRCRS